MRVGVALKVSVVAFISAQALAIIGSSISAVAIPWMLLRLNLAPDHIGWIMAATSFFSAVVSLVGFPFLARVDERTFCSAGQIANGSVVLLLAAILSIGAPSITAVISLLIIISVIGAMLTGPTGGIIRELGSDSGVRVHRINGIVGSIHNLGDMVGPVIGGALVALVGVACALSVEGASLLLSAVLLLTFIPKPLPTSPNLTDKPEALWLRLVGGIRYIAGDHFLRAITIVSALVNMSITALLVYVLPIAVRGESAGPFHAGIALSSFGVGALVASVLFTLKINRFVPLFAMLGSMFVATVSVMSMGLIPIHFLSAPFFLVGLCVGYLGPLESTLVQMHAPRHDVARVVIAYSSLRTLPVPVGFLLVSAWLRYGNAHAAFLVAAIPLIIPCALLICTLIVHGPTWGVLKPRVDPEMWSDAF